MSNEPSVEERAEQVALRLDKIVWEERDEDLRHTVCRTNGERAVLDMDRELHRVKRERIDKRAKDFALKWGKSAF
jgi:hypothetical protein